MRVVGAVVAVARLAAAAAERTLRTNAVMRDAKFNMHDAKFNMRMRRRAGGVFLFALFACCVVHFELHVAVHAQHETASDIEDGGRVFGRSCANCHGPDGNEIPGIDLGRGVFKTAKTDDDLVRIILKGVPGTPMPPTNMSEEQAKRVVAYLRSTAATKTSANAVGDAARGKALVEGKGGCLKCHRANGIGSRIGPDLTRIGQLRRSVDLERSLLDPAAEVVPTGRFYRVVTKDGVTATGRLLNIDTFTVQLLDTKEQLRSFSKATLKEHGFLPTPMPSFKNTFTAQELADVVSYLVSLKGRVNP
jgi:putative heme-binding domain-containing protein